MPRKILVRAVLKQYMTKVILEDVYGIFYLETADVFRNLEINLSKTFEILP